MVLVFEGTPKQYSMDGYVQKVLDTAKSVIKKDWDMIFSIDGPEGSGKSVFAQQCATYCDPGFVIDRITFTPNEFQKAVTNAQPYQAVIYDEAFTGLNSRATMSVINRALVQMLAEIRQKNLFIFVVMPTFFDLDKYVAIWRTRGLFHVYTGENFERGYVAFYNRDKKKDLYILGKKFYNYNQPKPNFIGRFSNHYTVEKDAYRKLKLESLKHHENKAFDKEIAKAAQQLMFERLQECSVEMDHNVRIAILGIPRSTYFLRLREYAAEKDNP